MYRVQSMISFRRGTPSVTFIDVLLIKWEVSSVICVAGSPMDWPAIVPTDSPGVISALTNLFSISEITRENSASENLYLEATLLEHRRERREMKKGEALLSNSGGRDDDRRRISLATS